MHLGHIRELAGVGAGHVGVAALGADLRPEALVDVDVDFARELPQQLAKELGGHQGHALFLNGGVDAGADGHFPIRAGKIETLVRGLQQHAFIDLPHGTGAEGMGNQAHARVDIRSVDQKMHMLTSLLQRGS